MKRKIIILCSSIIIVLVVIYCIRYFLATKLNASSYNIVVENHSNIVGLIFEPTDINDLFLVLKDTNTNKTDAYFIGKDFKEIWFSPPSVKVNLDIEKSKCTVYGGLYTQKYLNKLSAMINRDNSKVVIYVEDTKVEELDKYGKPYEVASTLLAYKKNIIIEKKD
jgi:hypothetical protein